ncbi:MAG TPA: 5'-nucleotidase C-terminal domain-containing protein, partial [Myxococcaceae bacterium]|nr:5'-nucleotidase C-terminal domain-containing protein [Myxococcaceae bacterium]
TEGEVVIEAYNHLGYAAAALGNHEFDYGPLGPASVASSSGDDPFGALKARLRQARFPILAVNVYEAGSGARPEWLPSDGTAIVELKGLKIGLIGLITPSTPNSTQPINVSTLSFGSLVPETLAAARRLRDKGADLVIGIAHAGGKCSRFDDPTDLSSCDTEFGEIFELLRELPPGLVDAMVAGHTHAELAHSVNGIPVVETPGLGRSFATLDLWVDPKTRRVLPERTAIGRNVAICAQVDAEAKSCDPRVLRDRPSVHWIPATFHGRRVVPDEGLDKLIAPVLARVGEEQRRKLGLRVPSPMARDYDGESPLGDFLADSLRQMEGADVALLNSGGLRADLPAGELEYGAIYEVIPFDNAIATISVNGEELRRLLHVAYGSRKGVFQVSGLKVTLARCPGQGRVRAVALADGRAIQSDKRYRVVLPDFLARGGDGLGPVMSSLPPGRIDFGTARDLNLRDALVRWWQKRGAPLVAPTLGRIQFVQGGASCAPDRALRAN